MKRDSAVLGELMAANDMEVKSKLSRDLEQDNQHHQPEVSLETSPKELTIV